MFCTVRSNHLRSEQGSLLSGGLTWLTQMPDTPTVIKGVYENKIRRSSPLEKIFEVFSTIKGEEGRTMMSFYDLMRAICPFGYSTKDIEELKVPRW